MPTSRKTTTREMEAAHKLGEAILEMIVANQEGLAHRHPAPPAQAPIVHVEHVEPKAAPLPVDVSPNRGLLTTADAAEYMSVSIRSIWQLVAMEELRPVRIGRAVRFAAKDVDAAIDRTQRGGI